TAKVESTFAGNALARDNNQQAFQINPLYRNLTIKRVSPIPGRRLDQRQGGDGGGIGAQDARAEADGHDEIARQQVFALLIGEAAFRADQQAETTTFEIGQRLDRKSVV